MPSRKKIDMNSKKIDLLDKEIMNKLGVPFWGTALGFCINLYPEDVEFISFIQNDPVFSLINKHWRAWAVSELNPEQSLYFDCKQIVFYEKYYRDPKTPPATRTVLFALLGVLQSNVPPKLLNQQRPIIESWFEKCR